MTLRDISLDLVYQNTCSSDCAQLPSVPANAPEFFQKKLQNFFQKMFQKKLQKMCQKSQRKSCKNSCTACTTAPTVSKSTTRDARSGIAGIHNFGMMCFEGPARVEWGAALSSELGARFASFSGALQPFNPRRAQAGAQLIKTT